MMKSALSGVPNPACGPALRQCIDVALVCNLSMMTAAANASKGAKMPPGETPDQAERVLLAPASSAESATASR